MRQIGTDGRSLAAVLAAAGALIATIAPAQAEKLTVETATRAGGLLRDIGASFEVVSTAASGIIMAIPTVWPEMIKHARPSSRRSRVHAPSARPVP